MAEGTYAPPTNDESEREWVGKQVLATNRRCRETHNSPCAMCAARIKALREDTSTEPGSAIRFLTALADELTTKTRFGVVNETAYPNGRASKASVYFLHNSADEVIYVGKARDVRKRVWGGGGHAATKPWFHEVESVTVYDFQTEGEAFDAEASWISRMRPRYNKVIPPVPIAEPAPQDMWLFEDVRSL